MRNRLRVCVPGLLVAAVALGGAPGLARADLPAEVSKIIDAPDYKHAHWGLLVVDRKSGEVLYEHNPDKLFAPASTTKLFSTAAALEALGAKHRFRTPVYARGPIDDGVLKGDLILVASGDLTFGGRTDDQGRIAFTNSDHTYAGFSAKAALTEPNPLAGLDDLARQVTSVEIKRIEGDVIIDDRLFDKAEGTGSGPGRLTPVIVNDNLIDFEITPTTIGNPAKIVWRPQTDFVQVDAQVDTVKAGEKVSIDVSSTGERITVRGKIPLGHAPFVTIHEVGEAASFARTLLIEALRRQGVEVTASPLSANASSELPASDSYAKLTKVAELESPPFSESAKLILKVSHNLHASTLPLLLAAKHGERTLGQGLRRQQAILKGLGVDTETISFGGGAGGDRADYITPRAAVQLLRAMAERPDFGVYREALPILGQDGTLAGIVPADSPAYGKFQAKTGTLLWNNTMNGTSLLTSKALAGYGTCQSGREVAIAMFVNLVHMPDATGTEKAGKTLGTICEVLYKGL